MKKLEQQINLLLYSFLVTLYIFVKKQIRNSGVIFILIQLNPLLTQNYIPSFYYYPSVLPQKGQGVIKWDDEGEQLFTINMYVMP